VKKIQETLTIDKDDAPHCSSLSQFHGADFSGGNQIIQAGSGEPSYRASRFRARESYEDRRELRRITDWRDLDFLRGHFAALGVFFTHDMLQFASGGIA
jgi:hypothetical protein